MSNSPSQLASCKKPSGCQNINHLPDDVLEYLLSFLSTKEVVATSILSKRWRSLWTYIPSLDKFLLNCDIIRIPSCLSTWIGDTISRRSDFIREVDISIYTTGKDDEILKLPNSFFTIKGLKILKLRHRILIDVPDTVSVCFPCLKILHLEWVLYANDKSVLRLLGGCTVLEELLVNRYFRDNVVNFSIYVPTLKTLNINLKVAKPWVHMSNRYDFRINAPKLQYFDIVDDGLKCYIIIEENRMSVCKLGSNFHLNGRTTYPSTLIKALPKTGFLSILSFTATLKGDSFPLFANLTLLHLRINYRGSWDAISYFLENCPNLHTLGIEKHIIVLTNKQEHVPKRLSQFLGRLYYLGFQGHEHELDMMRFILKTARALELVDIQSFNISSESKCCFLQKLEKFPRQSEKCKFLLN